MRHLLVLTTAAAALALAPPASAGTYTVRACDATYGNHSWGAHASNGSVTAYTSCPGEGIVTRMTGDSGNAPIYSNAHHGFAAPPGTSRRPAMLTTGTGASGQKRLALPSR